MKISKFVFLFAIIIIFAGSIFSSSIFENRIDFESAIRRSFSEHYLFYNCSDNEQDTGLNINLCNKMWNNPNDTKVLFDSLLSLINNFLPLSDSLSAYKIYFKEPKGGFKFASITITSNYISSEYNYNSYKKSGLKKVHENKSKNKNKNKKINYGRPIMAMWSGVKLYYGSGASKMYVGQIVCFKDDFVLVKYPDGNEEYKLRSAIINLKNLWYIDKDDPALNEFKYYECY